ncbi:MAG: lactonase family protein [Treponema sp.]|jgi:6-phosphogluconolactonase|nr:lactonase family protein [Treponema sp.]
MSAKQLVLVGTYTEAIKFGTGQILAGKAKGVYSFLLDTETGVLEGEKVSTGIVNPSWLTLNKALDRLYAVNELKEYEGEATGSVSAFAFDIKSRELKLLNIRPTHGTDPCHVILDPKNTHVFVSNFNSGSVCVFPVLADGALGEASQLIQHEGSSVNKARQSGPHAHALFFDNSGRFAFVPDLGIDRLMAYEASGALKPAPTPYYRSAPGSGPRHCVFHPNGKYLYLINELGSSVTALAYNEADASLSHLQTVPTIPAGFSAHNSCADIQITPDGRFLYGSNRGHDSIAIYAVDAGTGLLSLAGIESSGGKIPRGFCVDPRGAFLLAANQDTDNIVVFRIDGATMRKVSEHAVPTPVCVKTYELP